ESSLARRLSLPNPKRKRGDFKLTHCPTEALMAMGRCSRRCVEAGKLAEERRAGVHRTARVSGAAIPCELTATGLPSSQLATARRRTGAAMEGIAYPLVMGVLCCFGLCLIGFVVWQQTSGQSGAKRAGAALKLLGVIFGLGLLGLIVAVAYGWLKFQIFGG